jgi:hypothetical protein
MTLPKLATRSAAFALPPRRRRALLRHLPGSEWRRGGELGEERYWGAVVAQSGQQVSELHIVSKCNTRRASVEPVILPSMRSEVLGASLGDPTHLHDTPDLFVVPFELSSSYQIPIQLEQVYVIGQDPPGRLGGYVTWPRIRLPDTGRGTERSSQCSCRAAKSPRNQTMRTRTMARITDKCGPRR